MSPSWMILSLFLENPTAKKNSLNSLRTMTGVFADVTANAFKNEMENVC